MEFRISKQGILEEVILTEKEKSSSALDIVIPSNVKIIATGVFGSSRFPINIKSVIMPEGLTHVGSYAFFEQNHLEKIIFPSTIENIGDRAFYKIGQAKIDIKSNELTIESTAFWSADIISLKIESRKTILDYGAFSDCTKLKDVNLSKAYQENNDGIDIPDVCFYNNTELASISLPITNTIGSNAFASSNIKKLSIKSNGKACVINELAFFCCKSLEEVNFENDNFIIKSQAFEKCYNLTKINLEQVDLIERDGFRDSFSKNKKVYLSFKKSAKIEEYAFLGSNVYSIDLSKVCFIGASAFKSCSNLAKVVLPMSLEYDSIASETFMDTTNLRFIIINDNIRIIGVSAFEGSGLERINLSQNLQYISIRAFCYSHLSNVDFSEANNLESLGCDAFSQTGLKNVDLSYNFIIPKKEIENAFSSDVNIKYCYYSE